MPSKRDRDEMPPLTRKEQELLELFESHPGRCFSRAFLLRKIWGYSDDTRTRTVDVHVSRLRKKLEVRDDIAIHTVVRQGYVLEARRNGRHHPTSYASFDEDKEDESLAAALSWR